MGLIFYDCVRNVFDLRMMRLAFSQPNIAHAPGDSMSKMAFAAFSDHGRWAPTRAHANPSRIRYLALVLIDSGISESSTESIHVHSFPVCPSGSMGLVEIEVMLSRYIDEQEDGLVVVIQVELVLDERNRTNEIFIYLEEFHTCDLAFHLWHQILPRGKWHAMELHDADIANKLKFYGRLK